MVKVRNTDIKEWMQEQGGAVTCNNIARTFGIDWHTARRKLSQLMEDGDVERIYTPSFTLYVCNGLEAD